LLSRLAFLAEVIARLPGRAIPLSTNRSRERFGSVGEFQEEFVLGDKVWPQLLLFWWSVEFGPDVVRGKGKIASRLFRVLQD